MHGVVCAMEGGVFWWIVPRCLVVVVVGVLCCVVVWWCGVAWCVMRGVVCAMEGGVSRWIVPRCFLFLLVLVLCRVNAVALCCVVLRCVVVWLGVSCTAWCIHWRVVCLGGLFRGLVIRINSMRLFSVSMQRVVKVCPSDVHTYGCGNAGKILIQKW